MKVSVIAVALGLCACDYASVDVITGIVGTAGGGRLAGIEVRCKAKMDPRNASGSSSTVSGGILRDGGVPGPVEVGRYRCEVETTSLPAPPAADSLPAPVADALARKVEITFTDTDGADNGGTFAALTKTVSVADNDTVTLDVEMQPQ